MELVHKKWNIEYDLINPEQIQNLNNAQAIAMSEHINELRKKLAETSFLLDCHENCWEIPAVIENDYQEKN